MSFILNALRKSEAERKAILTQDASLLNADTPIEYPRKQKFNWRVVGFTLVNLLALIYILLSSLVNKPDMVQKPSDTGLITQVQPSEKPLPVPAEAPQKPGSIEQSSISELYLTKQKAVLAPEPKRPETKIFAEPKKPTLNVNEEMVPQKADLKENDFQNQLESLPKPVVSSTPNLVQPVVQFQKPSQQTEHTVKINHSIIPLLREMEGSFQNSVPTFTINVLAYSDTPSERFAIIDMTKYRIGQRLKNGIELKNILPDSLLMSFEGREFRTEGP